MADARAFSPLLCQTAGLAALHARARATHAAETGAYVSTGGALVLRHSMPLLARRYRFLHKIGEGTFAQLVCAEDTLRAGAYRHVAIKIMHRPFWSIGVREARMLNNLHARHNGELRSVLRLLSSFNFLGHFCLVFELLNAAPLSVPRALAQAPLQDAGPLLRVVRKVAFQVMSALLFLGQQGVIHADLKPENVLLVNKQDLRGHQSYAIKIIDFGNAMYTHEASVYYDDYEIQSLLYRAPEVLLGVPFGPAVDVWSVGCILAELCLGRPLFEAHSREQMTTLIMRMRGRPDPAVFGAGLYWRASYAAEPTMTRGEAQVRLTSVLGVGDPAFVSFLDGLLQLDPARRLTPWKALCHPFLHALFPLSDYVDFADSLRPLAAVPTAADAAPTSAAPSSAPPAVAEPEPSPPRPVAKRTPANSTAKRVKTEARSPSPASPRTKRPKTEPSSPRSTPRRVKPEPAPAATEPRPARAAVTAPHARRPHEILIVADEDDEADEQPAESDTVDELIAPAPATVAPALLVSKAEVRTPAAAMSSDDEYRDAAERGGNDRDDDDDDVVLL